MRPSTGFIKRDRNGVDAMNNNIWGKEGGELMAFGVTHDFRSQFHKWHITSLGRLTFRSSRDVIRGRLLGKKDMQY